MCHSIANAERSFSFFQTFKLFQVFSFQFNQEDHLELVNFPLWDLLLLVPLTVKHLENWLRKAKLSNEGQKKFWNNILEWAIITSFIALDMNSMTADLKAGKLSTSVL